MDKWLEVTVETTDAELDDLAAKLTMNGAEGLVLEDEADFKQFLEQNRQYWDYVDDALLERMRGVARIKFYVPDTDQGREEMAAALAGISNPVSVTALREEDWAYGWQKYYHVMEVGQKLAIVPEWEREKGVPDGRTAVYLNPGLTFGTGSHATTQLCLELLEEAVTPGCAVLDLGCGSGILAIAALKLGAERAIGVDIDPKAVDVAYENAAMNGIGPDRLTVLAGDVLSDHVLSVRLGRGQNQVVLANIVADVIIPLSGAAGQFMTPDGVFLCSGILDEREGEVRAALEGHGFTITKRLERKGWAALRCQKKQ